jgi:hypothetical protein
MIIGPCSGNVRPDFMEDCSKLVSLAVGDNKFLLN